MWPWICLWGRRHQKFPHNRSYSLSARVWWKWRILWHIIKERWKVPCVLQVGISITDTNLQVDLILVRDTQLTLKSFQNVLMNLDCRDWSVQMGNYLILIRQHRPEYLNLRAMLVNSLDCCQWNVCYQGAGLTSPGAGRTSTSSARPTPLREALQQTFQYSECPHG